MNLANRFGKYVNDIITCATINKFNFLRLNLFYDNMMLQFNVFFACMINRIVCQFDCTLIVTIYFCGFFLLFFNILKNPPQLKCHCHCIQVGISLAVSQN